jgi:hypothetical protein
VSIFYVFASGLFVFLSYANSHPFHTFPFCFQPFINLAINFKVKSEVDLTVYIQDDSSLYLQKKKDDSSLFSLKLT